MTEGGSEDRRAPLVGRRQAALAIGNLKQWLMAARFLFQNSPDLAFDPANLFLQTQPLSAHVLGNL